MSADFVNLKIVTTAQTNNKQRLTITVVTTLISTCYYQGVTQAAQGKTRAPRRITRTIIFVVFIQTIELHACERPAFVKDPLIFM